METIVGIKNGLCGFFKLTKHKGDADGNPIPGTEEVVADWFPNLITDNGKNRYANANVYFIDVCQVGTGNTAPSVGDTALANRVAGTATSQAKTWGIQGAPPYYGWYRETFRFATGLAAGNLAEVGVSPYQSSIGDLFSRALIVDGSGNPTTITVLSDEVLDVTYEFRVYPILTDLPGSITMESILRSTVIRAAGVTTDLYWTPNDARPAGTTGNLCIMYGGVGALGPITGVPVTQPAGVATFDSSFGQSRITTLPYVINTFYRDFRIDLGLNDANFTPGAGIGAVLISLDNNYTFQMTISPPLEKTAAKIMSLTFRVYWDRFTPP